jgi:hypothetical protein
MSKHLTFSFLNLCFFIIILEVIFSHQELIILKKYIIQIQFIYIKYKNTNYNNLFKN